MGDLPARLLPDFRAGAGVVGNRVIAVGELVEHLALAIRLHLQGQVAGFFHTTDQNQLRAVGSHRRLAFGGGVVRHDQHHAVTLDRRGHGQGDAGIAAGGLDQHITGLDVAALLGAGDHRQRRTVLYRTSRIITFQLQQQGVAGVARQALQTHQRGVADAIGDGWVMQAHGERDDPEANKAAMITANLARPYNRADLSDSICHKNRRSR